MKDNDEKIKKAKMEKTTKADKKKAEKNEKGKAKKADKKKTKADKKPNKFIETIKRRWLIDGTKTLLLVLIRESIASLTAPSIEFSTGITPTTSSLLLTYSIASDIVGQGVSLTLRL